MTRDDLLAIAREPSVAAFLHVIRYCEGTLGERGYSTIYGYRYFDRFDDHPRVKVTAGAYTSTAAGAYQFIASTWDEMQAKYGLPDFSPASQDAAAVGLLIRRRALDAIRDGDLGAAVELCNQEWASLPGSPYGQPTRTMTQVQAAWDAALSRTAEIVDRSIDAPDLDPEEPPMAPLVAALGAPFLSALIGQLMPAIPELARVFTDKTTPVNERNTQAAIRVLEAVQAATGAPGPASAVERVAVDSEARIAARQAVIPLIEIAEVGGGGIDGARKHAAAMMAGPVWQAIGYGMMLGGLALGVVLGGGAVMGMLLFGESPKPEVTAQILDYFKAAGFIVLGYVFGSSRSSQVKDQAIIRQADR